MRRRVSRCRVRSVQTHLLELFLDSMPDIFVDGRLDSSNTTTTSKSPVEEVRGLARRER
jgi:hypothetical protein